MKTLGKRHRHPFFTLAIGGDNWSASGSDRLTGRKTAPITHCTADLDVVSKRGISAPYKIRTPVIQLVASHCTDCAMRTRRTEVRYILNLLSSLYLHRAVCSTYSEQGVKWYNARFRASPTLQTQWPRHDGISILSGVQKLPVPKCRLR